MKSLGIRCLQLSGEDFHDVVEGDEQEETTDDEQADVVDGLLDLDRDGRALDLFDDEHDDVAAVEDGQGQEVDLTCLRFP